MGRIEADVSVPSLERALTIAVALGQTLRAVFPTAAFDQRGPTNSAGPGEEFSCTIQLVMTGGLCRTYPLRYTDLTRLNDGLRDALGVGFVGFETPASTVLFNAEELLHFRLGDDGPSLSSQDPERVTAFFDGAAEPSMFDVQADDADAPQLNDLALDLEAYDGDASFLSFTDAHGAFVGLSPQRLKLIEIPVSAMWRDCELEAAL